MKKGFIIGALTGLTIAGASLSFASSHVQALLNDQIKVTLNGVVQTFVDEKTNETQYPLTYNNRTYLPLRTVADLVGVDVEYDGTTNTAVLNNKGANVEKLKVVGEEGWDGEIFVLNGKYLVTLIKNPYSEAESTLIIADYFKSSRHEYYFDIGYDVEEEKFMYSIDDDKFVISAYEQSEEISDNGMTKLHRRDYEIIEKDGEWERVKIREDKTDVKYTAAT